MKNYDDQNFEEACSHLFEGAELTPSNQVWENIEKALDKQPDRFRIGWWWISGVAAALLLGALLVKNIYSYFDKQPDQHQTAANTGAGTPPGAVPKDNAEQLSSSDKALSEAGGNKGLNPKTNQAINQSADKKSNNKPAAENPALNTQKQNNGLPPARQNYLADGSPMLPGKQQNNTAHPGLPTGNPLTTEPETTEPAKTDMALLPAKMPFLALAIKKPVPVMELRPAGLPPSTAMALKKWWIGLSFTGNYFKPTLSVISEKAHQHPSVFVSGLGIDSAHFQNDLNNIYQSQAWTVGLEAGRKINQHLAFSLLSQYQQMSYSIYTPIYTPPAGPFLSPQLQNNVLYMRQQLLSTSLRLHWEKGGESRWNYGLFGGITTDVLLDENMRSQKSRARYNLHSTYRPLSFSALAGARLEYRISGNLMLGLEASYRRALQNVYKSELLKSTPQWTGLGLGIRYRF